MKAFFVRGRDMGADEARRAFVRARDGYRSTGGQPGQRAHAVRACDGACLVALRWDAAQHGAALCAAACAGDCRGDWQPHTPPLVRTQQLLCLQVHGPGFGPGWECTCYVLQLSYALMLMRPPWQEGLIWLHGCCGVCCWLSATLQLELKCAALA